jgi:hypothetical protein
MDDKEWLARCAERFAKRGGCSDQDSRDFAEACLESRLNEDDSPEDCADEDMSYWHEG